MRQIPFPFRFLFGKDVTFISMFPFDLAGSSKRKSFLGSGLCFHFWHYIQVLKLKNSSFIFSLVL